MAEKRKSGKVEASPPPSAVPVYPYCCPGYLSLPVPCPLPELWLRRRRRRRAGSEAGQAEWAGRPLGSSDG